MHLRFRSAAVAAIAVLLAACGAGSQTQGEKDRKAAEYAQSFDVDAKVATSPDGTKSVAIDRVTGGLTPASAVCARTMAVRSTTAPSRRHHRGRYSNAVSPPRQPLAAARSFTASPSISTRRSSGPSRAMCWRSCTKGWSQTQAGSSSRAIVQRRHRRLQSPAVRAESAGRRRRSRQAGAGCRPPVRRRHWREPADRHEQRRERPIAQPPRRSEVPVKALSSPLMNPRGRIRAGAEIPALTRAL